MNPDKDNRVVNLTTWNGWDYCDECGKYLESKHVKKNTIRKGFAETFCYNCYTKGLVEKIENVIS